MAPTARYESEDVDVAKLGKELKLEFSGKMFVSRMSFDHFANLMKHTALKLDS